jgi:hypothetical protein
MMIDVLFIIHHPKLKLVKHASEDYDKICLKETKRFVD